MATLNNFKLCLALSAVLSFAIYTFGVNNCLVQLSQSYRHFLNLPYGDSHILFSWVLLTVLADILLYRWVVWLPSKTDVKLIKSYRTRNISFWMYLLCRLMYLVLTCLPLLCEANTDSSLTMFVMDDIVGMSLYIYVLTLVSMALGGSGILIHYRNHFSSTAGFIVHIQIVCLILSDVPVFITTATGFPCGILTNTCVNLFAVGMGILYYGKYRAWVDQRFEAYSTVRLGYGWFRPKMHPNQSAKTYILGQVFGFLAISRVLNWWLASILGPTNRLQSINPVFGTGIFVILVSLWFGCALRLWYTAMVYKHIQFIIVPLEPVIIYITTLRDFLHILCLQFKRQKRSLYRHGLKFAVRTLNIRNPRKYVYRVTVRYLCRRISVWPALVSLLFSALPQESCLTSGILSTYQQTLALQNIRAVNSHINVLNLKEDLGKVIVPALTLFTTLVGAGGVGLLYVGQVSNGANMVTTGAEGVDALTSLDLSVLSPNEKEAHTMLLDHEKNKLIRGELICTGNIFRVERNQQLIPEHVAEKTRATIEMKLSCC